MKCLGYAFEMKYEYRLAARVDGATKPASSFTLGAWSLECDIHKNHQPATNAQAKTNETAKTWKTRKYYFD